MGKVLAITPNFTVDILMTIPVLQVGEVHRATTTSKLPGGKGVNVARVIQQFGHAVEIAGFLGGFNGQFPQRRYDSECFHGRYVWSDGDTPHSTAIPSPYD